jgi:hypothetical protein
VRKTYYTVKSVGVGDITSTLTDAAVASMAPAVEQMMTERVLPAMGIAILAGAIAAAAIGSWFATRPTRRGGRRMAL